MTNADCESRSRLAEIRTRVEAATPGPWYREARMALAGVTPKYFGEGKCFYCARMGDPIWTGRTDINGRRMEAHIHERPADVSADQVWDSSEVSHRIFTWPRHPAPAETEVCGNHDYEEGGVIRDEDAEFIAHARTDVPYLLGLVEEQQRIIAELTTSNGS